jgi:hypothetical protein
VFADEPVIMVVEELFAVLKESLKYSIDKSTLVS